MVSVADTVFLLWCGRMFWQIFSILRQSTVTVMNRPFFVVTSSTCELFFVVGPQLGLCFYFGGAVSGIGV